MAAVVWDGEPRGGSDDIASVGTTWQEVRMPLRTRRVTVQSATICYLERGQTDGAARSGGAAIPADAAYECRIGPPTVAELAQGYQSIFVAVSTGTATVTVRSEVS